VAGVSTSHLNEIPRHTDPAGRNYFRKDFTTALNPARGVTIIGQFQNQIVSEKILLYSLNSQNAFFKISENY
jgi:hypothetical protein